MRGLRAGHPFRVALALVAREMPDPVGSEFGIVSDEITFGLEQSVAVGNLALRVGHSDLAFFSTAVNIQHQTGGNLGGDFEPPFGDAAQSLEVALEDSSLERRRTTIGDCVVGVSVHPVRDYYATVSGLLFSRVKDHPHHHPGHDCWCAHVGRREYHPVSDGKLQVLRCHSISSPVLIAVLVFGAVAIAVFVVGQFALVQSRVRRRVAAHARDDEASPGLASGFDALVSTYFDEKRFGIEGSVRAKLRRELIRAGFFRSDAINYYIFARLATVVVLTTMSYLLVATILDQFCNGI